MKSSQRKGINSLNDNPAPTHYNPQLPNDAPKYSLTARSPIKNNQGNNPGPDHYDQVSPEIFHSRAPQYSIAGARAEIKSTANETPAPDTYNLGSTIKSKGTKMGTSLRSEMKPNGVPGPGNYEILGNIDEQLAKNVGATLKPRIEVANKNHTPSPGDYDAKLDYVKNHAPVYSIGTGARTHITENQNPPPGTYDPSIKLIKQSLPEWKMGTSNRSELTRIHDGPGPGQYEVVSKNDSKIDERS